MKHLSPAPLLPKSRPKSRPNSRSASRLSGSNHRSPIQRLTGLLTIVFLLAAHPVLARTYKVELVIFENSSEPYQGTSAPHSSSFQKAQQKHLQSLSRARFPGSASGLNTLAGIHAKLNASGQYRVLKTLGWTQRSASYANSPLINVSSPGNQLDGTVRVYAPNLLFTELNLRYHPGSLQAPTTAPATDQSISMNQMADGTLNARPTHSAAEQYFLQEKRRLKLKEIHYFDSPRFGAILSVVPLS